MKRTDDAMAAGWRVRGERYAHEKRDRPPHKTFGAVVARVIVLRLAREVPDAFGHLDGQALERVESILADEAERIERLGPLIEPRKAKVGRALARE